MPNKSTIGQNQKKDFLKSNPVFATYFKTDEPAKRPVSETVNKPLAEVSALLTNIKNFPLFLEYLEKVEAGKGANYNWHFKNAGLPAESVVVPVHFESIEGQGVFWKAEDTVGLKYSVGVQMLPASGGKGTVVRMMTSYESVVGSIASIFEKMFGKDAETISKKSLQRFKAFCETGHVPTIEGQSSGRDEDLIQTQH